MFPGTAGKAAGGVAKGAGALARGAAGLIPGIGGTLAAGVGTLGAGTLAAGTAVAGGAGYLAGKYIANPLLEKYTTETNQYGQKSDAGERAVGRVATLLPKSWGGITSDEYNQMYGAVPEGGMPGGAPAGAAPPSMKDPDNTIATRKNTEAINKLNENLGKIKPGGSSRSGHVGGSFR